MGYQIKEVEINVDISVAEIVVKCFLLIPKTIKPHVVKNVMKSIVLNIID